MLSIIIPTYNEEKYLSRLLQSIKKQTLQPDEIIIVDNNSIDKTVIIAKNFDCKVISGGTPAQARTVGAEVAHGDVMLFLDADTFFADNKFLERIIKRYRKNQVATVWYSADKGDLLNEFVCFIANLTKRINLFLAKKWRMVIGEYGVFIMCSSFVFHSVGKFHSPAKNNFMEDTFFFREAVKNGANYRVLPEKIYLSNRRLKNKNPLRLFVWSLLSAFTNIITLFKVEPNKTLLGWYEWARRGKQ